MTTSWWTFGLQTVNFLILVWLLSHFFWRPVAAVIERRRQMARDLLDQAQADRDAAAQALEEARRRSAGFEEEREKILAEAWREASEARSAALVQAEAEIATLREQSRTAIAQEEEEAARVWTARAGELALTVAARLAARLDGAAVTETFLRWLTDKIAALPADVRSTLGAAGEVEIVSAAPLEPGLQRRVGAEIGAALGASLSFSYRIEPDLIAGLELRTPHLSVRNSWRADLTQILAEINHDERI
ncbi:ATPase [Rhodoblastus sp.]|uniref:F0F1 ATP synthase subunit B family protein n=1 Tax=Rhodoblastus sp. TaxID=1962975 RepID=UPI002627810E|nr:ATPase [Rhodoblastus sp.]